MIFDPKYLLMVAPALLLALWAQMRIRSTYAVAKREPARLSGAAAARHILDLAGLSGVAIEQVPGHLSDHYDPREKVLRLSPESYSDRSLAAVGIAAHEAGHAIQDAQNYAPLVVRNAAVPAASFGSNAGITLAFIGAFFNFPMLLLVGIVLFGAVVFFQVVNLPVEFNASARAKTLLAEHGIVDEQAMPYVNKVLNAAALTYVAATLQAVMILLYYVLRYMGSRD
jgi:Zn-dependent membrane protease YugP